MKTTIDIPRVIRFKVETRHTFVTLRITFQDSAFTKWIHDIPYNNDNMKVDSLDGQLPGLQSSTVHLRGNHGENLYYKTTHDTDNPMEYASRVISAIKSAAKAFDNSEQMKITIDIPHIIRFIVEIQKRIVSLQITFQDSAFTEWIDDNPYNNDNMKVDSLQGPQLLSDTVRLRGNNGTRHFDTPECRTENPVEYASDVISAIQSAAKAFGTLDNSEQTKKISAIQSAAKAYYTLDNSEQTKITTNIPQAINFTIRIYDKIVTLEISSQHPAFTYWIHDCPYKYKSIYNKMTVCSQNSPFLNKSVIYLRGITKKSNNSITKHHTDKPADYASFVTAAIKSAAEAYLESTNPKKLNKPLWWNIIPQAIGFPQAITFTVDFGEDYVTLQISYLNPAFLKWIENNARSEGNGSLTVLFIPEESNLVLQLDSDYIYLRDGEGTGESCVKHKYQTDNPVDYASRVTTALKSAAEAYLESTKPKQSKKIINFPQAIYCTVEIGDNYVSLQIIFLNPIFLKWIEKHTPVEGNGSLTVLFIPEESNENEVATKPCEDEERLAQFKEFLSQPNNKAAMLQIYSDEQKLHALPQWRGNLVLQLDSKYISFRTSKGPGVTCVKYETDNPVDYASCVILALGSAAEAYFNSQPKIMKQWEIPSGPNIQFCSDSHLKQEDVITALEQFNLRFGEAILDKEQNKVGILLGCFPEAHRYSFTKEKGYIRQYYVYVMTEGACVEKWTEFESKWKKEYVPVVKKLSQMVFKRGEAYFEKD